MFSEFIPAAKRILLFLSFSKFKSCVDLTETAVKETITAHAIQANKGINKFFLNYISPSFEKYLTM